MGSQSDIEWTDATWTPLKARNPKDGKTGWHCVKISPACTRCYAATFNMRRLPNGGTGLDYVATSDAETYLDEKTLLQPLGWRKPKRVFVCSMTDLFGEWVTDEIIDRVFAVMALCPQHTFQVLTKRADRMADYCNAIGKTRRIMSIARELAAGRGTAMMNRAAVQVFPLPNVWLGVSVENQKYADERIPHLLNTPAAVRFLSIEPLLGPVNFMRVLVEHKLSLGAGKSLRPENMPVAPKLHWSIVGGESGREARPMNPHWVYDIRDQCRASGTAFFLKQFGEWAPWGCSGIASGWTRTRVVGDKIYGKLHNSDFQDGYKEIPVLEGKDFETRFLEPGMVGVVRVGKKLAGRLLDGKEYNEFPEVSHAGR